MPLSQSFLIENKEEIPMEITKFQQTDTEQIVDLFYDTVHSVNKEDYSPLALEAWAPEGDRNKKKTQWKEALENNYTYVAEQGHKLIGFADISPDGYLVRIFVHKDYQGKGVGSALLEKVEKRAELEGLSYIHADVSITAKPFFEYHSYHLVSEQIVEKKGVSLVNYLMIKNLDVQDVHLDNYE